MEQITLPIYSTDGVEKGTIELDTGVFDGSVNKDAIYQAIVAYRANQRKGLASTKTRGEVSGGGRKPWRQKGTGRARAGSTRSPLWRHGGVVFGPHPRDFSYELPRKIRSLALKSSLNAKVQENNFMVLDELSLSSHKTKEAVRIMKNLKLKPADKTLLLVQKMEKNIGLALSNMDFVKVTQAKDANVYDIMSHKKVVVTCDGLADISKRFAPQDKRAKKARGAAGVRS